LWSQEEDKGGGGMTSKMVCGWKGKVKLLGISSANAMVVDGWVLGCASSSLFSSAIDFRGLLQLYISVAHILPFFYIFFWRSCFCAANSKGSVPQNSTACYYYKRYKKRQKGRERERDSLGIRRVLSP